MMFEQRREKFLSSQRNNTHYIQENSDSNDIQLFRDKTMDQHLKLLKTNQHSSILSEILLHK